MALQELGGMEKMSLEGVPIGSPIAMCPTCHRVFSRPSNFDKHRKDGKCIHPSEVGLVLNKYGIYTGKPPKNGYKHAHSK